MAEGYYPEFYLKKRQREKVYNWIWTGAKFLILIVIGLLLAFVVFKTMIAPRRGGTGVNEKLADERRELGTQQRLDDLNRQSAQNAGAADQAEVAKAPDLKSIEYTRSLPDVSVSVAAGAAGEAGDATGQAGVPEGDAGAAVTPPEDKQAATPPAVEPPKEEPKQEKPPAEKPKTEEKPKVEKPKPKEKPAAEKAEAKPQEKPKSTENAGTPPASGTGGYSFNVYAGGYLTREAAESHKGELSTLGMSGSVQEKGGKYLIYIGSVSEIDQANALKSKLQKAGFDMAFVTRKSK